MGLLAVVARTTRLFSARGTRRRFFCIRSFGRFQGRVGRFGRAGITAVEGSHAISGQSRCTIVDLHGRHTCSKSSPYQERSAVYNAWAALIVMHYTVSDPDKWSANRRAGRELNLTLQKSIAKLSTRRGSPRGVLWSCSTRMGSPRSETRSLSQMGRCLSYILQRPGMDASRRSRIIVELGRPAT